MKNKLMLLAIIILCLATGSYSMEKDKTKKITVQEKKTDNKKENSKNKISITIKRKKKGKGPQGSFVDLSPTQPVSAALAIYSTMRGSTLDLTKTNLRTIDGHPITQATLIHELQISPTNLMKDMGIAKKDTATLVISDISPNNAHAPVINNNSAPIRKESATPLIVKTNSPKCCIVQ